MTTPADIAILGGGPGGYVAALRAARMGAQVLLIEENKVGGVCLNAGCIPTKALLRSAEVYRTLQRAGEFGLKLEGRVVPDWPAIQERKEEIVQRLVRGVERLLDRAGVQVLHGRGRFTGPRTLQVTTTEGVQLVEARNIVIASGARPVQLPLPGFDLPGVIDSTEALALEELPDRLLIVGGGVVGVEFADIWSAFGVEVTIVEMLGGLLPLMDADLGQALARRFDKRGIRSLLNSRVTRLEAEQGGLRAAVLTPHGEETLHAGKVLIAVGRRPNVQDLGLELTGVRTGQAGIAVDGCMQTNVPGIYAIGDVTNGAQLAHVASMGGEVAVQNALGQGATLNHKTVPSCVYTDPEIASVGLTEAQARQAGYDVRVGRFPLSASGKARTYGATDGFVKVVSEDRFGELLGLHIVGPHAGDLIHEGGLALALEATLAEIITTVHAHPTLGEAVREAALAARGEALDL